MLQLVVVSDCNAHTGHAQTPMPPSCLAGCLLAVPRISSNGVISMEDRGWGGELLDLSDELLVHIVQMLNVRGVGSIAQVCWRLNDVTADDLVWSSLYTRSLYPILFIYFTGLVIC